MYRVYTDTDAYILKALGRGQSMKAVTRRLHESELLFVHLVASAVVSTLSPVFPDEVTEMIMIEVLKSYPYGRQWARERGHSAPF